MTEGEREMEKWRGERQTDRQTDRQKRQTERDYSARKTPKL